jgi:hypothetical protein
MRGAGAYQNDCFSLGFLWCDGALERLAVLNDVILARESRSGQSDRQAEGEERGFHDSDSSTVPRSGADLWRVRDWNSTAPLFRMTTRKDARVVAGG